MTQTVREDIVEMTSLPLPMPPCHSLHDLDSRGKEQFGALSIENQQPLFSCEQAVFKGDALSRERRNEETNAH